jgi:iron complex transport system substrate-binding protein
MIACKDIRVKVCAINFVLMAVLLLWAAPGTPGEHPPGDALTAGGTVDRVMDKAGRQIRITSPFKRIISLYGAHTENLFALGLDAQIVGVSRHEVFPDGALSKPDFSYHDDPERFLVARPDLVLIRPMIERGYPQLVTRLEKSGITVVSLQPGSIPEMYRYWETLGMLTGRVAHAREMIRRFKQATTDFRRAVQSVAPRKKVYFEAIHSKMKTFAPHAMPIFVLETVGGEHVATDAQSVRGTNIAAFGKERILAAGPTIDVYLAQYGVMNRPRIEDIYNEPGFQVIKAVQNKNVHLIDEPIVSRPTFRLLNGMLEIGTRLYPEIFCAIGADILKTASEGRPDLLSPAPRSACQRKGALNECDRKR